MPEQSPPCGGGTGEEASSGSVCIAKSLLLEPAGTRQKQQEVRVARARWPSRRKFPDEVGEVSWGQIVRLSRLRKLGFSSLYNGKVLGSFSKGVT